MNKTAFSSLVVALALAILPRIVISQGIATSTDRLQASWLVTVQGEARTRMLRIAEAKKIGQQDLALEAQYGWSDGALTPIKAEIRMLDGKETLLVTTQANSQIAAVQNAEGIFIGTFTAAGRPPKGVEIKRLSADEVAVITIPKVIPPSSDVPASCAAFIGGRIGNWQGYGKQYLWVVEITPQCIAKYTYGASKTVKTAEIKDSTLSFQCGSSGGTCYFAVHGSELWGRYGGIDGNNSGVWTNVNH